MDIYLFVLWLVGIVGLLSISGLFLIYFGIKPQTKRLMEETKRLQLKMNQVRNEIGSEGGERLIKGAIGDIGISGLMDELGIDPNLLNNPLVKGLIQKYAPRLIEQLAKNSTGEKTVDDKTWL